MTKIRMTKLRSILFLTVGFALLLGALAAQDRDGDAGQFVILSAQYGTEYRYVDVTQRLKELARHPNGQERSFDFPDGTMFDGAQFRGWGRGDWGDEHWHGGWNGRIADNDHDGDRREFREHHDSGEFVILSAQYGTERRHVDV